MGIMVLLLETASLWKIYFDVVVKGKKDEKLGRMGVLDSADAVNSGLFESG